MALTGKPAVLDPRAFDLRAVQSTIAAVRERLRVLDGAVNTLQNAVGGSTVASTVTNLQQQIIALTQRVTVIEGQLGANDTVVLTAAAAMSAGAPVVPDGSTSCKLFDPTDPEAVFSCIGLVVSAVSAGQQVTVQRRGAMSITGAAFDQGRAVYADFGGDLTQYPSYGIVAGPVGVATGASTVWISPDDPALLMLSSAGTYEQFMPAAVRLVLDQDDLLQEQIDDLDALVAQLQYDMPALPLDIAYGGTGQTTANDALNALLPAQAGHVGEVLSTDGTNALWAAGGGGTVTSVDVTGSNGIGVSGAPITTSGTITLSLGAITPLSVNASGTVVGSNLSGTNTGDQTITLTGDVTGSGTGSFAATLATVNSNVGAFGSSTAIPSFTVNAKGLITAASTNAVVAPAGTLTGTTLAANVVSSSLTSLGTIGTGVWQGTAVAAGFGGTGIASYAVGDLLYASGATTLSKLADVATGNVLLSGGVATAPAWGKVGLTAHVTGTLPVANGGTGLSSGTSGGVLGFTASGTLASSGALTASALLLGGGAGATPTAMGSLGTTTTVLHGNASGAPTFGAVSLTADVTGTLPVANGGTGVTALSSLTANPSASVGLSAVNGSASTFMRSDGAPALSQSISPTWTGNHTFTPSSGNTLFSAGFVGIGITPVAKLHIYDPANAEACRFQTNTSIVYFSVINSGGAVGYFGSGGLVGAADTNFVIRADGMLLLGAGAAEKARLDGSANLMVGATSVGTSAAKVLGLGNATAPSSSPAGMGQLYVESGALKYRGSSGTVTTVAAA